MIDALRRPAVVALVVAVLAAGCVGGFDGLAGGGQADVPTATDSAGTVTDTEGVDRTATVTPTADRPTVAVVDENGTTLGVVSVRVADSITERYTGLSNTESLGPNEGMFFVHDDEDEYAYVMRDMAFPIDIVFVDANGTITAIHHAETESRPYTRYEGRGRYVLEVPYEWTTRHGVEVGDRIEVEYADGADGSGG